MGSMEEEEILSEPPDDGEDTGNRSPTNSDPQLFLNFYQFVRYLLINYGWQLLFAFVAFMIIYEFFLKNIIRKWQEKRTTNAQWDFHIKSAEKHQAALEAARMRMQERQNKMANDYSEKMKEKEEQKRKERIEEFERHEKGQGYYSKLRHNANADDSQRDNAKKSESTKDKPKNVYRQTDYNPLGGSSNSCAYRPNRRGPSTGG